MAPVATTKPARGRSSTPPIMTTSGVKKMNEFRLSGKKNSVAAIASSAPVRNSPTAQRYAPRMRSKLAIQ